MPYRSFRDAEGTEWEAWDVVPQREERRRAERRADSPGADLSFDRRRGMERRLLGSHHASEYDGGWLCFQCDGAKRRLSPIPTDWPRCDDVRLRAHLEASRPVRRASGRPGSGVRRSSPAPVVVPAPAAPQHAPA